MGVERRIPPPQTSISSVLHLCCRRTCHPASSPSPFTVFLYLCLRCCRRPYCQTYLTARLFTSISIGPLCLLSPLYLHLRRPAVVILPRLYCIPHTNRPAIVSHPPTAVCDPDVFFRVLHPTDHFSIVLTSLPPAMDGNYPLSVTTE